MSPETIAYLNALNRAFYRITAPEFDQTRQTAWVGWERLLPRLQALPTPLRVLDVGCGNGRFGAFLAENGVSAHYHGMDNSPELLAFARQMLASTSLLSVTLTESDVVLDHTVPHGAPYDVVVVFGVLHHVPYSHHRQQFLAHWANQVRSGGIVAFASWRFFENERLRARVVAWDSLPNLPHPHEREPGDYVLDWRRGERAFRYCHYVDDDEERALVTALGEQFRTLATYRADGQENRLNAYCVLERA